MIWKVRVGVNITFEFDDIEAKTREQAEGIARHEALYNSFVSAKLKGSIDTSECGTSIYSCEPFVEEENDG